MLNNFLQMSCLRLDFQHVTLALPSETDSARGGCGELGYRPRSSRSEHELHHDATSSLPFTSQHVAALVNLVLQFIPPANVLGLFEVGVRIGRARLQLGATSSRNIWSNIESSS